MADAALIRNRLARARVGMLDQISRVLDAAIQTGRSAKDVALHVSQYLAPYFSTRRAETGGLLRAGRVGIAPNYPAGSGLASYPARFIATEEVALAHGNTVKRNAERLPGWFLKWTLAPGKRHRDTCDANAKRDVGFGKGIYRGDSPPIWPEHRSCRCVLVPIHRLGAQP
jgi:hypothetical protein